MKKIMLLSLILILSLASSSTVFGYVYWSIYKFSNGIADGTYYNYASDNFNQDGTIYNFKTALHGAMNEWNSATESNILNDETNNGYGDEKLALAAYDYGELGLNGWAVMYVGSTQVSGSNGSTPPTQSWNFCRATLNAHDIQDDGAMTQNEARAIAIHEVGHCLGLAHEDDGTASIMASGETSINNGWLIPQTDDVSGVNNRY